MQTASFSYAAAFLAIASLHAATAQPPPSICAQRDVLDFAAREIVARDAYAKLERASVTEMPTTRSGTVSCTAYVNVTHYDAARFGMVPVSELQIRRFTVKRLDGGFEVSLP